MKSPLGYIPLLRLDLSLKVIRALDCDYFLKALILIESYRPPTTSTPTRPLTVRK